MTLTALHSIAIEIEGFGELPFEGARGPKPKVSADSIYEHALAVIDAEGLNALTVRRLASDIRISTRTLYKRIGDHDRLLLNVAARHVARLDPPAQLGDSWREALTAWSMGLYRQLVEQPHATALLTHRDHDRLHPLLEKLIECVVARGVTPEHARDLCRVTTLIAFNAAVVVSKSRTCGVGLSDARLCELDVRSAVDMVLSGQPSLKPMESSCI